MDRSRAISVRQPATELILRGVKKAEYRSRPTTIRGRVMLNAAMKRLDWPEEWRKVGKEPGQLPVRGGDEGHEPPGPGTTGSTLFEVKRRPGRR